jgi:hypothetical protein
LAIDQNTSAYKIYIAKDKVMRITNQVKFDQSYFQMKEAAMRRMPRINAASWMRSSRLKTHFRLRTQ